MKKQTLKLILIALMVLGIWRAKTAAETGDVKSSKSELKLLYDFTLPECISGYSVKQIKDEGVVIDKILTLSGIYSVTDNKKSILLRKRSREIHEWTRCDPRLESFSHDGKLLIETVNCGEKCSMVVINHLERDGSIAFDWATSFGAISNHGLFLHTGNNTPSFIADFAGKILAEFSEMATTKSFSDGFICSGMDSYFYFLNSSGEIHAKKQHHSQGISYDVDYVTGTTALIVPNESLLYIYDSHGKLKTKFKLPFPGYAVGIGISEGGEYAVVISSKGWIRLFDIDGKKELWKKDLRGGGRFVGSSSPIPISYKGEYVIVYGDLEMGENPKWSFIVFNKEGTCVSQIEAPVPRNMISYYHMDFIPGTKKIVGFTDNTLSVYEIAERD